MDAFYADFFERLTELHKGFVVAIDGLSVEALDWTPGADVNSLAVLVAHTAGAERYWIGDVAGEDPSGRVRSEEFKTGGRTAVELQALLAASIEHSRAILAAMTLDDLGELRTSSRDGRTYTVAWALLHALEHTALHLGHAQIGRQLVDKRREQS